MAWLHSKESREWIDFPVLGKYEQWLIDLLKSIGTTSGDSPLTYAEMQAWQSFSKKLITGWEAETLHLISAAYLSALHEYRNDDNAERPYYSDAGLDRYKQEYSARVSAMLDSQATKA